MKPRGCGEKKIMIDWFKELKKDAEQGDAHAQFKLAICYENGDGVKRDLGKAKELYEKAAKQGHKGAQFHTYPWGLN